MFSLAVEHVPECFVHIWKGYQKITKVAATKAKKFWPKQEELSKLFNETSGSVLGTFLLEMAHIYWY